MKIHNLADFIVRKYQTRNPFDIIREKNAILVYAPLINVRGFYQYFQRNHIIYINENLSSHDQKFVCAHELGHMLLHKNANTIYMDTRTSFNTDKYEIEANQFAVNLLIPDEMILENCHLTPEQLSRLFGYEQALIDLRLKSFCEI